MGLLFCLAKNVQEAENTDHCADLDELAMEFLVRYREIHGINMDYFNKFDPYGDTILGKEEVQKLMGVSEKMISSLSDEAIQSKLNALNKEDYFTIEEVLEEVIKLKGICEQYDDWFV